MTSPREIIDLESTLEAPSEPDADRRRMPATNPTSSRRFTRLPFDGTARLFSSTAMWETSVVDLSLRGILVTRPDDWNGKLKANFRLELRLAGTAIISMAVTLANTASEHLGFKIEHLDWNSFQDLKRLIELNLGDSESLFLELSALGNTESADKR